MVIDAVFIGVVCYMVAAITIGGIREHIGSRRQQKAWTQSGYEKKTCPDCAEKILAEAKVCKHCGNRKGMFFSESDKPDELDKYWERKRLSKKRR